MMATIVFITLWFLLGLLAVRNFYLMYNHPKGRFYILDEKYAYILPAIVCFIFPICYMGAAGALGTFSWKDDKYIKNE